MRRKPRRRWIPNRPSVTSLMVPIALCSLTIVAMRCKTKDNSELREALVAGAGDAVTRRSMKWIDRGNGEYEVRLPNSGRLVQAGQKLTFRYGVVQKRHADPFHCSPLPYRETVQLTRQGKYLTFSVKLDPSLFTQCQDTGNDADGYKLSLQCQQSGDWEGPKVAEGCLSDMSNSFVIAGRAVPEAAATGFGLDGTDELEHRDSVLNYGKVCAERLGPLPRDWSCLDGEIIPITKNGVEIPFGQHRLNDTCDAPAYLGLGDQRQCVPYARLGRLYTKKDVETVFICRRYKIGERVEGNRIVNPISPDTPLFQDVAVIQHNIRTGETCYFQALSGFRSGRDLPAVRIPPPDEEQIPQDILDKYTRRQLADGSSNPHFVERRFQPEQSVGFWIKPSAPGTNPRSGFQCVKCHDSDPFMHSPYVDQLNFQFPAGHLFAGRHDKMVPCNPAQPAQVDDSQCIFHQNDNDYGSGLYSMVHNLHNIYWPKSEHIAPKDDKTCVKCHRLGSLSTCTAWARDSLGDERGLSASVRRYRSEYGRAFPNSHWMPLHYEFFKETQDRDCKPDPDNPEAPPGCRLNKAQWDEAFRAAGEKVLECCMLARIPRRADEFSEKCERSPITTRPPRTGGRSGTELSSRELPAAIPDAVAGNSGRIILALGPSEVGSGQITYLKVTGQIDHGSHTNLRVSLQRGEATTVIFDGQRDVHPGSSGELNFDANSVDHRDRLGQFVGQSLSGQPWQVVVEDRKVFETGTMTDVKLALYYD